MSFLVGKTVQTPNANPATTGLQNKAVGYIGSDLNRLFPQSGFNPEDYTQLIDYFKQLNMRNLAMAKESAGNLTGSGFANTLGARAAEADAQQAAMLSQLDMEKKNADANRMATVLLGLLNSNAGGVTTMYQPGFLDYALQGAGAVAGAGGFNGLFGGGGSKVNPNSYKG